MNNIKEINLCISELLANGCEVIVGINKEDCDLAVIFYSKCSKWAFVKKSVNEGDRLEYGVIKKVRENYEMTVVARGDNFITDTMDFIEGLTQSATKPKQEYFEDILLLEVTYSENSEYVKKSHWKYINNACFYKQGGRFIDSNLEENIKGYYSVDGLHSHHIGSSTELARVLLTTNDEIIVIYINEAAKYDDYAQQKIQECISWLNEKVYEGYGL